MFKRIILEFLTFLIFYTRHSSTKINVFLLVQFCTSTSVNDDALASKHVAVVCTLYTGFRRVRKIAKSDY
jgi:hypothetical protein